MYDREHFTPSYTQRTGRFVTVFGDHVNLRVKASQWLTHLQESVGARDGRLQLADRALAAPKGMVQ